MDVEHYRNFITIVDCGNISAAAKELHIAQPALTAQIKAMQKKFNAELLRVRRGARSVELTDAGALLYDKARSLCALEDSMKNEIVSVVNGVSGKLSISLSPSMSIMFIRNFLSGFVRQNPQVEYYLYEVGIQEQTRQLLSGVTEIGVANARLLQPSRFETLVHRREQLGVVFHKDTRWIPPDKIYLDLKDLENIPLCLSRGCSEQFLGICSDSQISPHILCINSTKYSTITWASEQLGVAIVPIGPGETFGEDIVVRFLHDDRMYLDKTLSVVKGRPLSAVAKNFLKYYSERDRVGGGD